MGLKELAAVRVKEAFTDHISVPVYGSARKWKHIGCVF
jgi:hypothetical protein